MEFTAIVDNFALSQQQIRGGMGLYFGKVRATGSSIRGFEGAGGGVIRWIAGKTTPLWLLISWA